MFFSLCFIHANSACLHIYNPHTRIILSLLPIPALMLISPPPHTSSFYMYHIIQSPLLIHFVFLRLPSPPPPPFYTYLSFFSPFIFSTPSSLSQQVGVENVPWRITDINQDFSLCETYSPVLGVPANATDDDLRAVAQFRSKGRIPVSCSNRGVLLYSLTIMFLASLSNLINYWNVVEGKL